MAKASRTRDEPLRDGNAVAPLFEATSHETALAVTARLRAGALDLALAAGEASMRDTTRVSTGTG